MKIWCLPVGILDRKRLLGEHSELHCMWNVIRRGHGGWYNHPQTNRFKGHLGQLKDRHEQQIHEMTRRKYHHKSPLPDSDDIRFEAYSYPIQDFISDFSILIQRDGYNR